MNNARIAGIAVAVGLIGAGSIAYAAIPDPAGVVHACYNKGGLLQDKGAVRVVDQGEQCRANELAMTWNQTGQQGPAGNPGATGATGAPGTPGPKGDTGPAGFSDSYQQAASGIRLGGNSPVKVAELSLPAGSYVLSGKAQLFSGVESVQPGECLLSSGDETSVRLTPDSDELSVSVQDQLTLEQPGMVTMSCWTTAGWAYYVKLTALKVGVAHSQ